MTKTKYIKVPTAERLPEQAGTYLTISGLGIKMQSFFNNGIFEGYIPPKYWLEEIPDREDEMREMLEDILDQVKESFDPIPGLMEEKIEQLLNKQ